jgi:hypothetical protein
MSRQNHLGYAASLLACYKRLDLRERRLKIIEGGQFRAEREAVALQGQQPLAAMSAVENAVFEGIETLEAWIETVIGMVWYELVLVW